MASITWRAVVRGLMVVLAAGFSLPSLAAESPPAAFNNHCRTCHSVKEGDNRLGPSLHNIHGAKAGSSTGYAGYSQGLKSSGVVWDDATLDKFIENPDQVVPNNNMKPYKGIADPAVRKEIVEFLRKSSKQAEPA